MGKLIGALLGLFIMGPIGAIFGFLAGALFDARVYISSGNFFFNGFGAQGAFNDSFPLFAAALTKAGGVNRTAVLTVKNITTQLFGRNNAVMMMKKYKIYVENGYSEYQLDQACENVLFSLDHQSKIYIISTLFTILKAGGTFSSNEIFTLQSISRSIGISGYEFETMLNHFRSGSYSEQNYSHSTINRSDPYKILEIDKTADTEEIKKKFRTLSKKYHPDLTSNLPKDEQKEAEIKMKEIINAYQEIKKERRFK